MEATQCCDKKNRLPTESTSKHLTNTTDDRTPACTARYCTANLPCSGTSAKAVETGLVQHMHMWVTNEDLRVLIASSAASCNNFNFMSGHKKSLRLHLLFFAV